MEEISSEDQRKIQLEMLQEIDAFCRKNNIKYMLAYGTLLGAIRHKGFIPWDDDVDISMPLEDMRRFKKSFVSEKIEYHDGDTDKYFDWDFSKISYKPTYAKVGKIFYTYGVNIDLYPVVECPSDPDEIKKKIALFKKYSDVREFFLWWRRRFITRFPIKTIPGYLWAYRRCRNYRLNEFPTPGGGSYYFIAGLPEHAPHDIIPFNPFEELIDVEFEGFKFKAPARYHEYLTIRYGDYMQLPPEDQRTPYHGGHFYWK